MQALFMEETRDALRKAALARRNGLLPANRCRWSRLIQAQAIAFPPYRTAHCVALYRAFGNEVETCELRDHSLRHGKRVFCPDSRVLDSPTFVELNSDSGRGPVNAMGSSGGSGRWLPDECSNFIVFVPGLLFDRFGSRLGRGGGWYDRALGRLGDKGVFVGLAYDCQIVDQVPEQPWDQKVHYVITESRVIDCAAESRSRR